MVVSPGSSPLRGPASAAGHAQAGRHSLDPVHGVAAPGDVQAVGLAVAEGEAGHPGHHHGGRVVAGVAAAALAQPQPVADPVALRYALGGLPPGEVEHLPDPPRQREDHLQAVHDVGLAAQVGQRVPGADRAARHRLDLGHQPPGPRSRPRPRPGPGGRRARTAPAGTAATSRARPPGRPRRCPAGARTGPAGRTSPPRAGAAGGHGRAAASSAAASSGSSPAAGTGPTHAAGRESARGNRISPVPPAAGSATSSGGEPAALRSACVVLAIGTDVIIDGHARSHLAWAGQLVLSM